LLEQATNGQRHHADVQGGLYAPTNREIAAALGIPKGTVDSGLIWIKRKLA
jgi:DNA-directed RNA polymerase specialized sigma24 family protein